MSLVVAQCLLQKKKIIKYERTERRRLKERKKERKEGQFRKPDRVRGIVERND